MTPPRIYISIYVNAVKNMMTTPYVETYSFKIKSIVVTIAVDTDKY